jgi:hypothetical protein
MLDLGISKFSKLGLAKLALSLNQEVVWTNDVPLCIRELLVIEQDSD